MSRFWTGIPTVFVAVFLLAILPFSAGAGQSYFYFHRLNHPSVFHSTLTGNDNGPSYQKHFIPPPLLYNSYRNPTLEYNSRTLQNDQNLQASSNLNQPLSSIPTYTLTIPHHQSPSQYLYTTRLNTAPAQRFYQVYKPPTAPLPLPNPYSVNSYKFQPSPIPARSFLTQAPLQQLVQPSPSASTVMHFGNTVYTQPQHQHILQNVRTQPNYYHIRQMHGVKNQQPTITGYSYSIRNGDKVIATTAFNFGPAQHYDSTFSVVQNASAGQSSFAKIHYTLEPVKTEVSLALTSPTSTPTPTVVIPTQEQTYTSRQTQINKDGGTGGDQNTTYIDLKEILKIKEDDESGVEDTTLGAVASLPEVNETMRESPENQDGNASSPAIATETDVDSITEKAVSASSPILISTSLQPPRLEPSESTSNHVSDSRPDPVPAITPNPSNVNSVPEITSTDIEPATSTQQPKLRPEAYNETVELMSSEVLTSPLNPVPNLTPNPRNVNSVPDDAAVTESIELKMIQPVTSSDPTSSTDSVPLEYDYFSDPDNGNNPLNFPSAIHLMRLQSTFLEPEKSTFAVRSLGQFASNTNQVGQQPSDTKIGSNPKVNTTEFKPSPSIVDDPPNIELFATTQPPTTTLSTLEDSTESQINNVEHTTQNEDKPLRVVTSMTSSVSESEPTVTLTTISNRRLEISNRKVRVVIKRRVGRRDSKIAYQQPFAL